MLPIRICPLNAPWDICAFCVWSFLQSSTRDHSNRCNWLPSLPFHSRLGQPTSCILRSNLDIQDSCWSLWLRLSIQSVQHHLPSFCTLSWSSVSTPFNPSTRPLLIDTKATKHGAWSTTFLSTAHSGTGLWVLIGPRLITKPKRSIKEAKQ